MIFLEYAVDVAKVARQHGIKNVAVTAGYIAAGARGRSSTRVWTRLTSTLRRSPRRFIGACALAISAPASRTLRVLEHETQVWFEITTLLIPGHNDNPEEVKKLSEWVMTKLGPDVPLHFTAFHPDYKMLDLPHTPVAHADDGARYRPGGGIPLRLHRQHP